MFRDHLAVQSALSATDANDSSDVRALEGVVQMYDPTEGTVTVQIGDCASVFTDRGDSPAVVTANLLTPALGQQYAPVGGERCTLFRTQSGYSALIEHGPDDTPQAPAGEHWVVHYDPQSPGFSAPPGAFTVVSYAKFTNDGKMPDDNAGGWRVLVGGFSTIQTTGGITITLDDDGHLFSIVTPGGQTFLMDDTNNSIRLQGAAYATESGLVRQVDLAEALMAYKAAEVAASVPNSPSIVVPVPVASTKSFTG